MAINRFHIGALSAIFVAVALAIATAVVPWTTVTARFDSMRNGYNYYEVVPTHITLWGVTTTTRHGSHERSWGDILDNDRPACVSAAGTTNRDELAKLRVGEAGAVIAVIGAAALFPAGLVRALAVVRHRAILVVPTAVVIAGVMMAFFGFTSVYNTCEQESLCKQFVQANEEAGGYSVSCAAAAGQYLVWVTGAVGIGAFGVLVVVVAPDRQRPPLGDGGDEAAPPNATIRYRAMPDGDHPAATQQPHPARHRPPGHTTTSKQQGGSDPAQQQIEQLQQQLQQLELQELQRSVQELQPCPCGQDMGNDD